MPKPGYVYLLSNGPNGTLYIGVTSDLVHHIGQHKTGETLGFASRYGVGRLVWFERHEDIRDAITREKQIKKWNRAWKLRLVRKANPTWRDLFDDVASLPAPPLAMEDERTDSYTSRIPGRHPREGGDPCAGGSRLEGAKGANQPVREIGQSEQGDASPHPPMDSRLRGNDVGGGRGAAERRYEGEPLAPEARRDRPARGFWRAVLGAVLLAMTLAGCAGGCSDPTEIQLANEGPEALAALAVEVGPRAQSDTLSETRAFVQASGGGAYLYDALAHAQDDPAMGLIVGGARVLDSWNWWLDADSLVLDGDDRHRGVARPDFAVRAYLERDTTDFVGSVINKLKGDDRARFVERVTLLDSRDSTAALVVHAVDSLGTVAFRPAVASGAEADSARTMGESLVVYAGGTWTAIRATGGTARVSDLRATPEAGRDAANVPGEVRFETPGAVVVATGPTPAAADSLAGRALQNEEAMRQRRAERLAALVEAVPLATEDEAFDRAMRWAVVSLDGLISEDSARVTVAPGLPGASPQPGLSTVQTTQALLALGRWEAARKLVATFGRAQVFDRQVDLLGRAPNVVTASGDAEFVTADATPLLIAASGDYVRTTGDRTLVTGADDFWFKAVFAMRGLYEDDARNGDALDARGFLLSREGRSAWMETDPASGGFERRGPVVEAQGALYRALGAVRSYAEIMGVAGRSNTQWYADTARVLQSEFERRFLTERAVADRLSAQGPVAETRPAAFLALDAFDFPPEARAR
ncbi:MAG: GIY-YIG nuclease family protein, partial [Bacteroidota bacterium]